MHQPPIDPHQISIHSLRVEGDITPSLLVRTLKRFQSTPSVWRETQKLPSVQLYVSVFQSTPSVWRETPVQLRDTHYRQEFQSTPSVWRETKRKPLKAFKMRHFNPLPPCGGRLKATGDEHACTYISIHSLRVEGDAKVLGVKPADLIFQSTPSVWRETKTNKQGQQLEKISIHSLRVEGDFILVYLSFFCVLFQSTPSVWRETLTMIFITGHTTLFQSTPSVWRETDMADLAISMILISIHSLRVEGDISLFRHSSCLLLFQSTPSVWRETDDIYTTFQITENFNPLPPCGGRHRSECDNMGQKDISIHSLRVEGDYYKWICAPAPKDFNPLPPCGGRHIHPQDNRRYRILFQSTPSVWRETGSSDILQHRI